MNRKTQNGDIYNFALADGSNFVISSGNEDSKSLVATIAKAMKLNKLGGVVRIHKIAMHMKFQ